MAIHGQTSRTRIGVQSALGTVASTLKDIEVMGPANPLGKSARKTAPNNAQLRRRREGRGSIMLQKSGSPVEFSTNLKGLVTPLTSAATPVAYSHASALSHQLLYRMIFGGELAPAAGSAVVAVTGTPITGVEVTAGHGSRFVVGQIVYFVGYGARRVTAISTDTLTIAPPLTALALATVVRNAYQYFPAEADSTVFSVQHTFVESGTPVSQMQALGVHGGGEFKLEINAAGELSFKGTGVDWSGPDDLSIADDPVADDMGDVLVWQPTLLWVAFGATVPSVAEISSMKVSLPRKWQEVTGAVVQGIGSVHEVAGRGEPITIEISGLMTNTAWSDFSAATEKSFVAYTTTGTGSAERAAGVWAPRTRVIEAPQVDMIGELVSFTAKLQAFMATDIAGANPALSVSEIQTANLIWFNA